MNHKKAFGIGLGIGAFLMSIVITAQVARAQRDPQNVGPQRYGDFNVTGSQSVGNASLGSGKLKVEQSDETLSGGFQIFRPSAAGTSARIWIDSSDVLHITRGSTDVVSISASGAITVIGTSGGNMPNSCQKRISSPSTSTSGSATVCNSGEYIFGGGCFISSGSANITGTIPDGGGPRIWFCSFSASVTWTAQAMCCAY